MFVINLRYRGRAVLKMFDMHVVVGVPLQSLPRRLPSHPHSPFSAATCRPVPLHTHHIRRILHPCPRRTVHREHRIKKHYES